MQKHFFKLLVVFQLVTASKIFAQNIALNATGNLPDTSAMLDVSSSNKGFLMPRMTAAQVGTIPFPATGLIIYNTSINAFQVNTGTTAAPSWETLGTTVGNWLTGGNSGTNSGNKFLGTTDNSSLRFRTNNTQSLVLDSLGNVGVGATPSFTASPNADKFLVDAGTTNSYNVITAKGNVNNYLQFNVENQSSGTSASSDLVATADNGSETSNFIDMGVNGSGYTGGVMGAANDAYLFNVGNNLLVGTGAAAKSLIFLTGGTSQASYERMRIDGTGKVGIGTTSPGSPLDVKGTLRLSGATSGYVGFTPAATAGSTTYTLPTADGASGQVLSTNGTGTLSWATASSGATTHTLSSATNTITSIVNGVTGTATAVNTVANTSTTNTLSTTVNGVAGAGVPIINSHTLSLTGNSLTSTVNGVASSALNLSALDSSVYKMDGTLWTSRNITMAANNLTFGSTTGNLIFNPSSTGRVGIGTTSPGSPLDVKGILRLSGATSGYVGFAPAAAAGSTTYTLPTADGISGQALTTNGTGTLSWASPSVTTTHTLSSATNTITSTVNGITGTATAVNTVANTSTTNTLSTTVNGVATTAVSLLSLDSSVYKMDGTLWASRNITLGANNLTFGSTTGNLIFNPSSTGRVGIGTTSPGSPLDVKGILRLSGATSGYVGFAPAAAAGSTTYTLPTADGTSGQVLSTNGSGTLSWASAGSGATTNTLTSATNVITSKVNGITATANAVNTVANASTANTLTTTVNGVAGSSVNIINTNATSVSGTSLTTTVNGVASTPLDLSAAFGTLGWKTNGNAGMSASTNFIGTTDANDLIFKRNNTAAGSLLASSTSFGVSSSVGTTNASAFGASANASGSAAVAIGYNAAATMANAVAIGPSTLIQAGGGTDDIAIGTSANVSGGGTSSYSTSIGSSAQVQASNALAIGKSASVNSQYALAIGDGAQAQGTSAVVIGQSAYSNSTSAITIGTSAQAQGIYDVSIGYSTYASSQDAIAIGDHAQAQGTNSISIGTNLYNGSGNTVAIGNSNVTTFLMNGASGSGKAVIVGNSSSNGNGAYLTTGGTWTNASDVNLKDDFTTVDADDILNKVAQLDITRWKYKGTGEYHIGPMAQDFYKSFDLGNDNKHISTIDPAGIALVSIKALKKENDELNKKLDDQQLLIEQLQKSLEEIKAKLK